MSNYQKVRTTQPSSVKHAGESYSHAAAAAKVNDFGNAARSIESEDLVKNYNQFQQRMNEMKLRAQHLQDLQTMKAMGVGVGTASSSQNPDRPSGNE